MKFAPNPSDRNEIKRMTLAGHSPEEISRALLIQKESVESWAKHFLDEDKADKANAAKQAKAAEAAAAAAKAEAEAKLRAEIRAEIEAEMKASPAKTTAAPKVNK